MVNGSDIQPLCKQGEKGGIREAIGSGVTNPAVMPVAGFVGYQKKPDRHYKKWQSGYLCKTRDIPSYSRE